MTPYTPNRRHLLATAASTALAYGLGSAHAQSQSSATPGGAPIRGGTLTIGLATNVSIIDPHITGSSATAVVARNLVDSLVGQAEDNRITPWLAERWDVNADNTVFTFHLRQGVTFSDGTPLDAAAVKYNLDRILDPKTTSSYAKSLLGPVSAIETPGTHTVVIRYAKPFAPLLQGLSLPYVGIQSPTYLRQATSTTNHIVGSGPFVLESYTKGSGSRLRRRDDYQWGPGYATHQGPAHLDALVFRYLPEPSVRVGALTSGQVQVIDDVPAANRPSLARNPRVQLVTRENPGVVRTLLLNTARGPFQDVKVRQALQSAIDPKAATQAAYADSLKPADNILGPATEYYDRGVAASWGFDLARANRLLDEAGWQQRGPDGVRLRDGQRLSVRHIYDTTETTTTEVTLYQVVQSQARQAGFDLQFDPVDSGGFTQKTGAGDYDILSLYYVRAEPDILRTVFHSSRIPPKGANYARVASASLDARLEQALGAPSAERERLYREAQAEIIGQAYAVPLVVSGYQLAATTQFKGLNWATNAKPNFYDTWLQR
ncbi:MAG: ABC transporter substrate-binding protein [Comamonas sp.]